MRRIPRPSWAAAPSAYVPLSARQRPSSAAFSTTLPRVFLLPGKQDKKKHQQFVRRWQKRLLGDSEPIGAHVDPYDPTSPVRIAPEEQGEYEEVLAEDDARQRSSTGRVYHYLPAEEAGVKRPGVSLRSVGTDEWLQQRRQGDMAREFEKLTGQTYTPLTIDLANDIETLTGSPYTLRDDNLAMAQTVHEVTGRPYTRHDFGLHGKPAKPDDVRHRFIQAVAEVYALKEAGLDMDLARFPNRGVYDSPRWVRSIQLRRADSGELALAYPKHKSAEAFIKLMQSVPEWDAADEELLVEEDSQPEPVVPLEPAPAMDPATPAFKRKAVVKIDPSKKPFDFMSNRPSPRAKSVVTPEPDAPTAPFPRLVEVMSAFKTAQSAVSDLRRTFIEYRAQSLADDIAALRRAARSTQSSSTPAQAEEVKWRHVAIDAKVKFALFKRLFQLTGIHISDPHLTSSRSLGDLYGHLCAAAKPQPTSLYSVILTEGQKARQRAKQQPAALRRKPDLGDLITLGNVEIRTRRPNKTEKRTKSGAQKVVDYALHERGLHRLNTTYQGSGESGRSGRSAPKWLSGPRLGRGRLVEGTRNVPEFGRPVPSGVANLLASHTRKQMEKSRSS